MKRFRRLRASENLRSMVRETRISKSDLIYPMFVVEGENIKKSRRVYAKCLSIFTR